jgi:DNA-directed RNA polymerase subunit RPC12/RpoP
MTYYHELDLSKFGYREMKELATLLTCCTSITKPFPRFTVIDKVGFNMNSGNVFLIDEDSNVVMMNGNSIEEFISCPNCGHEDFYGQFERLEDIGHHDQILCPHCQEII